MAGTDCQDGRAAVHDAAMELYQIAALFSGGDENQAVELVESAVAQTSIDPCADAEASVNATRVNLVETAVARLSQADPGAFDVPASSGNTGGCIEDDDLASTGISASQLAGMLSGPGRRTLREWLNKLPAAQRAIFIQRAILGWDNTTAAASLSKAVSSNWQPGQVSEVFRQALCSLANSLVHSAAVGA
jgi:DNA-directed RNA polymerase specialized sigma24 family protein